MLVLSNYLIVDFHFDSIFINFRFISVRLNWQFSAN